jgi:hypothetical protein
MNAAQLNIEELEMECVRPYIPPNRYGVDIPGLYGRVRGGQVEEISDGEVTPTGLSLEEYRERYYMIYAGWGQWPGYGKPYSRLPVERGWDGRWSIPSQCRDLGKFFGFAKNEAGETLPETWDELEAKGVKFLWGEDTGVFACV